RLPRRGRVGRPAFPARDGDPPRLVRPFPLRHWHFGAHGAATRPGTARPAHRLRQRVDARPALHRAPHRHHYGRRARGVGPHDHGPGLDHRHGTAFPRPGRPLPGRISVVSKRFHTGSHDLPVTPALEEFMRAGWLDSSQDRAPDAVAAYTPARRRALGPALPGEPLMIRAGELKQRSNDQYYRFRPHSAYVWLTGDQSNDGVLVLEPDGEATLYLRPRSSRDDGEFFLDRKYGELWTGRRPTLRETEQ